MILLLRNKPEKETTSSKKLNNNAVAKLMINRNTAMALKYPKVSKTVVTAANCAKFGNREGRISVAELARSYQLPQSEWIGFGSNSARPPVAAIELNSATDQAAPTPGTAENMGPQELWSEPRSYGIQLDSIKPAARACHC